MQLQWGVRVLAHPSVVLPVALPCGFLGAWHRAGRACGHCWPSWCWTLAPPPLSPATPGPELGVVPSPSQEPGGGFGHVIGGRGLAS